MNETQTSTEIEGLSGELLEFLPECGATQHDFEVVPVPDGMPTTHIYCRQCGSVRVLFEAKHPSGGT